MNVQTNQFILDNQLNILEDDLDFSNVQKGNKYRIVWVDNCVKFKEHLSRSAHDEKVMNVADKIFQQLLHKSLFGSCPYGSVSLQKLSQVLGCEEELGNNMNEPQTLNQHVETIFDLLGKQFIYFSTDINCSEKGNILGCQSTNYAHFYLSRDDDKKYCILDPIQQSPFKSKVDMLRQFPHHPYTDVCFKVRKQIDSNSEEFEKFHAHKIVLAVESSFFNALFQNDMKEKNQKVITIGDVDSDNFSLLLSAIYGDVSIMDDASLDELESWLELFSRFGCTCLARIVIDKIFTLEYELTNVGVYETIFTLAVANSWEDVKTHCINQVIKQCTIFNVDEILDFSKRLNIPQLTGFSHYFRAISGMAEGVSDLTAAVMNGDPFALLELGSLYRKNNHPDHSLQLFLHAAKNGNLTAMANVGTILYQSIPPAFLCIRAYKKTRKAAIDFLNQSIDGGVNSVLPYFVQVIYKVMGVKGFSNNYFMEKGYIDRAMDLPDEPIDDFKSLFDSKWYDSPYFESCYEAYKYCQKNSIIEMCMTLANEAAKNREEDKYHIYMQKVASFNDQK